MASVLYVVDPEVYFKKVVEIFKGRLAGKNVIYITTNKTCSAMTELFKSENVDMSRIFFIDCISQQISRKAASAPNCVVLDGPKNVTQIGIAISKAMVSVPGEKTLFLDSLSTMLIYNDSSVVGRFSNFLMNKAKGAGVDGCIMALSSDMGKDVVSFAQAFADKVEK